MNTTDRNQNHPCVSPLLWDGAKMRAGQLILIFFLVAPHASFAQSSANSISFQGALTGAGGQPLANGNYSLTFKFYTNATTPTALATSNVPNVPVTGGIASTPIPVDAAWFNGQTCYLGITLTGGVELTPRVLITAVPYAMTAQFLRGEGDSLVTANLNSPSGTGQPRILTGRSSFHGVQGTSESARFDLFDTGIDDSGVVINQKRTGGQYDQYDLLRATFLSNTLFRVNSDVRGGGVFVEGRGEGPPLVVTRFMEGFTNTYGALFQSFDGDIHRAIQFNVKDISPPEQRYHFLRCLSEGQTVFSIRASTGATCVGSGNPSAQLDVRGPGNGFDLIRGFGTNDLSTPVFRVTETGTTVTRVLQITGGADLAEHLSITDGNAKDEFKIEPGMVVSIDPSGNRKFKLSDELYDRKRVGIISGGNGVKPGLILGDEGNPAVAGDQPIALTGQVWCHADAAFGPITPGDLLTTSSTPGHAMRVSEDAKARFAVLGQALTGLAGGRGWVQVLVGKQ